MYLWTRKTSLNFRSHSQLDHQDANTETLQQWNSFAALFIVYHCTSHAPLSEACSGVEQNIYY